VSASPSGPAQATPTAPPPQQAQAQGRSHIGRILGVLGVLILYGKNTAERLRQHAGTPAFTLLAKPFGTTDLAAVLSRIVRGIRLAVALHQRLTERAARGLDITPSPLRVRSPRKPRTPRPRRQPASSEAAPDVVALPTPEQIAVLLRRKSVGVVIADICRDLGITPHDLGPELWNELHYTIIEYGGSLSKYLADMSRRLFPSARKPRARFSPSPHRNGLGGGAPTIQSSAPTPPALATGPP
jgi:hypothetical protein